jgi:hydroxymethylpyrimidine/phosphomethylpyrimidine kinase
MSTTRSSYAKKMTCALPCALTIAGLDPGGGAGILADLRGFDAAGAFGCAVAALLTVQSTSGLRSARPVSASLVLEQARMVVRDQRVRAVKIGALGSIENVRAVAGWLGGHADLPVVVDPVLLPSAGRGRLLEARALGVLKNLVAPRATLVTANIPEAEALLDRRVHSLDDARDAALGLVALGARAALVKGGHLTGKGAVDVLAVGTRVFEFGSPRLRLPSLHGGGCTLASLIAGRLAVGRGDVDDPRLIEAVRWARRVHQRALRAPFDVGGEARVLVP